VLAERNLGAPYDFVAIRATTQKAASEKMEKSRIGRRPEQ